MPPTLPLLAVLACAVLLPGPSAAQARALALASEREEAWVEVGVVQRELAADDELVYRLRAPGRGVEQGGLELVLADGTALAAPLAPASAWSVVRTPLASLAGASGAAVRLVLRGPRGPAATVLVDELRIEHADGSRTPCFDEQRGLVAPASNGTARLVPAEVECAPGWLPGAEQHVGDPWLTLDFEHLRAPRPAGDASPGELPHGAVWDARGVPFLFAGPGSGSVCVPRGQRLVLAPLDGGRFYDLHLALEVVAEPERANQDGAPLATHWKLLDADGEALSFRVDLPAETNGLQRVRVALASQFSVVTLELCDEPRLRLHAATLRWRKDGPADADFCRAWVRRERPSAELEQYLARVATLAEDADVRSEQQAARELFRRLRAGDVAGFDALLAERLGASARVETRPLAGRLLLESLAARAPERGEPTVFGTTRRMPPGRELEALRAQSPAEWEAWSAAVRAANADPAPAGWTHARWGTLGEEAFVRQLQLGQDELLAATGRRSEVVWFPGDATWFRQLPQLARLAGAGASIGEAAAGRAPAQRWTGPDGEELLLLTPSPNPAPAQRLPSAAQLAELLERAAAQGRPRALHLAHGGSADDERRVRALAEPGSGFEVERTGLAGIARAWDARRAELAPWKPARDDAGVVPLRAWSDELQAWNRRAEDRLYEAELAAVLARAGAGLEPLHGLAERLWKRLLASHELAELGPGSPAAVAEAREIAGLAEALAADSLEACAAGAPGDAAQAGRVWQVFNPLPWERTALVRVDEPDAVLLDARGRPLANQRTHDGGRVVLATLPAFGTLSWRAVSRFAAPPEPPASGEVVRVDGWRLDNGRIAVEIDPASGAITQLSTRAAREGLLARGTQLVSERGVPAEMSSCELLERGPLRAVVRARWKLGGLELEAFYVLAVAAERLEVELRLRGHLHESLRLSVQGREFGPAAVRHVPFAPGWVSTRGAGTERAATLGGIAHSSEQGLGLASDCGLACGATGAELALWLADPGPEPALQRTLRWALVPVGGRQRDLDFAHATRELRLPLRVQRLAPPATGRSLPAVGAPATGAWRLTRIGPGGRALIGRDAGVTLCALAATAQRDVFLVRVAENTGLAGELRLELPWTLAGATRVDLAGRELGALELRDGRTLSIALRPWSIATIALRTAAQD